MNIMKNRMLAAAVFSAALLFITGCILNPKTEPPDPLPPIEWPKLSEMEDVIETISLCYEYYKTETLNDLKEHYTNILYNEGGNEYVWYFQEEDVLPGGDPYATLDRDVAGSAYVWENASALDLTLSSGTWITNLGIEGCDDCWLTARRYTITTTINHDGEELLLNGTDMTVQFIVRPQYNDPGKWAIFIAYDLPAQ